MSLRRKLRWLAIVGPGLIAGAFETLRHRYLDLGLHDSTWGNIITMLLVIAASWLFLSQVFRWMDRAEVRLQEERAKNSILRERDRIAGELHDGVSQSVFYLNVKLDDVEEALRREDVEGARRELAEMREAVQSVHRRLRQAIFDLRAAEKEPSDFVQAVRRYLADVEGHGGTRVRVGTLNHTCRDDCPRFEMGLLRILQEAVFNAQRHSGARNVTVTMESDERGDYLEVADDGVGFDLQSVPGECDGHFGLTMMRTEAARLGGSLAVITRPGEGCVVRFERLRQEEGKG